MNVHSVASRCEGLELTVVSDRAAVNARLFRRPLVADAAQIVAPGSRDGYLRRQRDCGGGSCRGRFEKEISVSLGVVFPAQFGGVDPVPGDRTSAGVDAAPVRMWSAIAIHDTSSVVGAASAYGSEALEVATTVKLARALWIIPVSLLSALLFRSKGKKTLDSVFIGFFILAMLANSYLPFVDDFNTAVVTVSKAALVVTLFLIGAGLSVSKKSARSVSNRCCSASRCGSRFRCCRWWRSAICRPPVPIFGNRCGLSPIFLSLSRPLKCRLMDKAKAYIDEHKERFVGELFELLRIPSVSAQSVHAPDVVRCAELLAGLLVRSRSRPRRSDAH